MGREGHSSDRGDAQRVVDALADLFDALPPSDRAGAEDELRAAGIDPDRIGQRVERLAAAVLPPHRRSDPQRTSRPTRETREAASLPAPRRPALLRWTALAAASAAAVLLTWAAWHAQPEPLARRVDAPSVMPSLLGRGTAPHIEPARNAGAGERLAARSAPGPDSRGAPASVAADADSLAKSVAAPHVSAARAGTTRPVVEDLVPAAEPWWLDRTTWEQARDLLPDPVLQRVRAGDYRFKVEPLAANAFARNFPSAFRGASRANLGRYEANPDTCALRESGASGWPTYFFGLPFPVVDPQDAAAACEIMWNVEATNALEGGQDAALIVDDFDSDPQRPSRRIAIDLRRTAFLGRSDPLRNPDDLRSSALLRVTVPSGLEGTATLTRRSNDPSKHDAMWSYVPALRRVRAVSPVNRSDGFLGSSLPLDDFGCFDGKLEDFEWRLIGEQTLLAPMTPGVSIAQADQSLIRAEIGMPAATAVFEHSDETGAPWLVVEDLVLVPRAVWVLEATPRDRYYLTGRLVLYVDAALYRPYWLLAYSRQGELHHDTMCAQRWSRSADRTLGAATASLMTSVDGAHARASLARYTALTLDQGQPDDGLYTVQAMSAR